MLTIRDLIFLAIDYDTQDIAYKLANLGPDLGRREKVGFCSKFCCHFSAVIPPNVDIPRSDLPGNRL